VHTYKIVLEMENRQDIGLVIEKGLRKVKRAIHANDSDSESEPRPISTPRPNPRKIRGLRTILKCLDASEVETIERIRKYVWDNAQGVFLWVTLILSDLEEHAYSGRSSFKDLEFRLKTLPLGLNELYGRMLQETLSCLPEEEILRSRTILKLVDGAGALGRPMSIRELWEALAVPADCNTALKWEVDPIIYGRLPIRSWTGFRRQIRRKCGQLVEIIRAVRDQEDQEDSGDDIGPDDVVQFVHRTVKDFFEAGSNGCSISFTEEEAVEEVQDLVRRYSTVAFPQQETKYRPDFRAVPHSSWRKNVEKLVQHLDTRILLPFVADITARSGSSQPLVYAQRKAFVLDSLFWSENIPLRADDYPIEQFTSELQYYPQCIDGISHTVISVRAALLGYATHYACNNGLAIAAGNLGVLYWDERFVPRAQYVMINSALRTSIEQSMVSEVVMLTRNGRHYGFNVIPRKRKMLATADPFVTLAKEIKHPKLLPIIIREAEKFCNEQEQKYSSGVTTVESRLSDEPERQDNSTASESQRQDIRISEEVDDSQYTNQQVDSDVRDAVRAILRRWDPAALLSLVFIESLGRDPYQMTFSTDLTPGRRQQRKHSSVHRLGIIGTGFCELGS
jgi:hypothetical protein